MPAIHRACLRAAFRSVPVATVAAAFTLAAGASSAASCHEPPVFASQNGVLDIMMVARPRPIPTINFTPPHSRSSINPIGWAYDICKRPATGLSCPAGSPVWDYGGVRLALQQGDTPKSRFGNPLPQMDPTKANPVTEPGPP